MIQFTETEYDGEIIKDVEFSAQQLESIIFYNCIFENCDFSETAFKSCKFNDCEFKKCILSVIGVKDCSFSNVTFNKSKIMGVNWSESKWKKMASGCTLQFDECNLSHSTFIGLNLKGILVRNSVSRDVDFRESDLTNADFQYTDLTGSIFMNTNLTNADFCHATNYSISVTTNKTKNARFMLPEAMSLLYCLDINLVD
ncbi:pentapeptide repeat-containing protein [Paenibacillus alkalitolerans]|uniref:pentapeptide repeat-containing protein n=1 Tax=Paenibacillus alkalitolerans TaxID=2799335 RepID=UPI0018F6AAAD|nr:pentapeptide repeat-containing protein [Paenibacillus alkalitolerans]